MINRTHQSTLSVSEGDGVELEDIDWTFEGVETDYLTHGLHAYPARMIPQIPEAIIQHYKNEGVISEGGLLYDPFLGSGTSAVEAKLHGLHAEGNDINPFACLLTEAKTEPVDVDVLRKAFSELFNGLESQLETIQERFENGEDVGRPDDIRDGWFPEPQLQELWEVRKAVDALGESYPQDIVRVFRLALAETTREISYQRNGEYKRYRMAEEDRSTHNPSVFSKFSSNVRENVNQIESFSEKVDTSLETTVHYSDSRTATENGSESVEENSADIVITSPPYGDHRTTVTYGEFSQDPAIIAGEYEYDEMKQVDKRGLGGGASDFGPEEDLLEWSPSFGRTMETLREEDGRAEDAMEFVRDYFEVMKEVAKVTKPGQPVVWVVANRTMSRVNIPTHLITQELCEHIGYTHETTLPREIPTKTLPWENAPESVEGAKGDLMADENIVIMRSPEVSEVVV